MTTFYVYGLGLIGQEEGLSYKTFHYDRRGNTIALTDETGTVTDEYSYSPYGESTQLTGTTTNEFLYVGQYGVMTDSNGLNYMRARYYNPEIKAFVNEDVVLGSINDALSLNRYAYGKGNPVLYVDPSGNITLSLGFNGSGAVLGMSSFTGMISIDHKGNIALQVTTTTGLAVSTPSLSLTGLLMATNAPTVEKLRDSSYQTGGLIGIPIGLIPAALGGESIIIPDKETGKYYYGFDILAGLGTPGTSAHLELAHTETKRQLNLVDLWNNLWNSNKNRKTDHRNTVK